jgi:hypothetical protein
MRIRAQLAAGLLLSSLVACGGDNPVAPDLTFEGTYVLRSMNGQSLPYSKTMDGYPVTVKSGTLLLKVDGTYVVNVDADVVAFGETVPYPVTGAGTYARDGESVTLSLPLNGTAYDVTGVHEEDTMTLSIADPASPIQTMVLVKRRG